MAKMKKTKTEDRCPWCKYIPGGCTAKDCDFKELPYEREAILKRLKQEADAVIDMRDNIIKNDDPDAEVLENIMDISYGMQIMTNRLKEDFDVTDDEIKELIGAKKLSMWQKAKLAAKTQQLRSLRKGGKK